MQLVEQFQRANRLTVDGIAGIETQVALDAALAAPDSPLLQPRCGPTGLDPRRLMSLILDALKKSEAERQRQTGPTLLEVRITQPRRRYPIWVIAVGALLAVNMLLLLVFVLRRPARRSRASTAASVRAGSAAPVAASVPAHAARAALAPQRPWRRIGSRSRPRPVLASAAATDGGVGTLHAACRGCRTEAAAMRRTAGGNPADDEPAVPAARGSAGHYASLPSFSESAAICPTCGSTCMSTPSTPRDRYALINMHRVHEGDVLPEGPRVLAITREGVALDYRGQDSCSVRSSAAWRCLEQALQLELRIGGLLGRRRQPVVEQPLGLHVVLDAVQRVDRDQAPARK